MQTETCPGCASENPPGSSHCEQCGGQISRSCTWCGQAGPVGRRFCGGCGAPLVDGERGAVASRGGAGVAAAGPSALRRERKHVTVLFADISNSTSLIDDVDPEQALDTLDPALNTMREVIRHYGGTVNEVRGDGVMALFGAPVAQEDHALRACHAALALQRAIEALPGDSIRVRVGLNSGEVVVRAILNDLALDYTAVGPTVHLAARLEQMAEPGKVLISDHTERLAGGFLSVRSLGAIELRGIAEPLQVFELEGSLEERSRWEVRASQGLARFANRELEIAELEDGLRWAAAGYRRLATVSGPAGIGKSRLVHEFAERARADGWTVLEASGSTLTQGSSYLPVRKILEAWLGGRESDDPDAMAAWLREKLEFVAPGSLSALSALEAVLDLPVSDSGWKKLDPDRHREQIRGAVLDLFSRIAESAPLVLIFEDLQWMDVETRTLLEKIAADQTRTPLLVVATFRRDFASPFGDEDGTSAIQLDGLDDRSSEILLRSLLGDHAGLARLIALLVRKASGVPLFLEETLRDLVEADVLKGSVGSYRPVVGVDALQIPDTIEAVLGARLDRLPPQLKQLLQTASVFGREIPVARLAEVTGVQAEELAEELEVLCRQDFLRRLDGSEPEAFVFRHALTQDVAYNSLLRSRRRALHLRVVEALEAAGETRRDEQVEELGYHAHRGESWEKAADYLRRAGLKAMRRSAHRDALLCFEQALGAIESLPKTEDATRTAIGIRMMIRGCLIPLGDAERVVHQLSEAEKAAAEIGDSRWLGIVYANTTYSDWLAGRHAAGIGSGLRALALSRELDDLTVTVTACFGLGLVYHGAGRFREAVEVHQELVARIPPELWHSRFNGPACPAVLAQGFLAYAHAELGVFDEAEANADRAVRLAEELGDVFGLVLARIAAGHTRLRMDRPESAIEILEPAVEECRRANMPTVAVGVMAELGAAYAASGEPERAIRDLVEIVEVADDEQIPEQNLDRRLLALGFAHLVAGEHPQAIRFADAACESATRHGDDGARSSALLLNGIARARHAPHGQPEPGRFFEQALKLAAELALAPLEARTLLENARWQIAIGAGEAGRRSALSAADRFGALGLAAARLEALEVARESAS